jgi:membrane glycosyltransferase
LKTVAVYSASKQEKHADATIFLSRKGARQLMPICNEEVSRCFAGVEVMYRSLAETGQLARFDF